MEEELIALLKRNLSIRISETRHHYKLARIEVSLTYNNKTISSDHIDLSIEEA